MKIDKEWLGAAKVTETIFYVFDLSELICEVRQLSVPGECLTVVCLLSHSILPPLHASYYPHPSLTPSYFFACLVQRPIGLVFFFVISLSLSVGTTLSRS